jgi:hypothetical protein
LTVQLINRHVPIPPRSARRRVWVRVGQQLRFASGLCARVELQQGIAGSDLRMYWHFGPSSMGALTCYEPVSLVSDCGQRVVIRAVAVLRGQPLAVLAEVEGVDCLPRARVEEAA